MADEVRISDWSSEVCSSDLLGAIGPLAGLIGGQVVGFRFLAVTFRQPAPTRHAVVIGQKAPQEREMRLAPGGDVIVVVAVGDRAADRQQQHLRQRMRHTPRIARVLDLRKMLQKRRSEEHTSELQSLMRISYAVFCLKKNNDLQKTPQKHTATIQT